MFNGGTFNSPMFNGTGIPRQLTTTVSEGIAGTDEQLSSAAVQVAEASVVTMP